MAAKIIEIIDATGTQGGGIIDFLAGNPEYKLRGVTRNPNSAVALDLAAKGVKVVQADLEDLPSRICPRCVPLFPDHMQSMA